ncbi:SSU ribosomal protein S7p (S5e) [Candidatus Vidania fulgoroideae]|nr:SSU ribosomal protein S7p (S5e) [Candidatus Vidania fulgoroideae]
MSRRKRKYNRIMKLDEKYLNYNVEKLINIIMISGKKNISRKIVYSALSLIREKYRTNPIDIFEKAVLNATPEIEIKNKKIGGTIYKIPVSISKRRGEFMALSWFKKFSRLRKERNFSISLFKEIVDTYNGSSNSIYKKKELYKLADLNRAFAHFAF